MSDKRSPGRRRDNFDEKSRDRFTSHRSYTTVSGRMEGDTFKNNQFTRAKYLHDRKRHADILQEGIARRYEEEHRHNSVIASKRSRLDIGLVDESDNKTYKKNSIRRRHRRNRKKKLTSKRSVSQSSESTVPQPKQATGVVSDEEDFETTSTSKTNKNQKNPRDSCCRKKSDQASSCYDDTVGHFRGGTSEVIQERYRIIREVGIGTFGRVLECLDLKRRLNTHTKPIRRNPFVAIKIVRNVKRYYDSALIEAGIIAQVNRHGGRGVSHCAIMHESFPLGGHYCLVFESLGPSLYDFLKRHNYQPFPMFCVQDFAVQLLEALEFLHSLRLIHTDLKIENILLMNNREVTHGNYRIPESTKIKIIDFGGACYDGDKKSSIINTRQYRAPEVILGIGWSMPSDMWSTGCILAELFSGDLLFPTHNNIEHLALIEKRISQFPSFMINEAKSNSSSNDNARKAFDSRGWHRMERALNEEECSVVRRTPRLEHLVHDRADYWFLGLLSQMLRIDPTDRATAHECLHFLSRCRRDTVSQRLR